MSYKKRNDDINPQRKYKGILYNPHKSTFTDEDLTPVSRSKKSSGFEQFLDKVAAVFGITRRKKAETHATFSHVSHSLNQQKTDRTSAVRVRRVQSIDQSPAQASFVASKKSRSSFSTASGSSNRHSSHSGGSFLRDHFVRTIAIITVLVLVVSGIAIPTSFAKPTNNITINDSGRILVAPTTARTVGDFLTDNKIEIGKDDILEAQLDDPISDGMELIIRRAMPLTIKTGNESIIVNMIAGTVADALAKAQVVPAPDDEVYPSPDTYIRSGMVIDHIVVETKNVTEVRAIPYEKDTKEDSKLAKGKTDVVQEGEDGELQIVTKQIYKNGMLISEDVISEDVTKKPITQITAVGTYVAPKKKKPPTTSQIHGGGGDFDGSGKYTVTMQVTAYCSNCNSGNRTSSGTYPSIGTVAAKAFPYGTKLYIPGYGYGRVEDTGGFASNVIDVYMGDQSSEAACNAWGRKTLTITVIG
ncbi:MAG: G5 domain-containing protein [Christensenellaceae bacterium]